MTELPVFLAAVALCGLVGFGLGIVFLAPRLLRHDDRDHEDPGARPD